MAAYRRGEIPGIDFHYAHTSGHATVVDLQKFAAALKPKMLVPIHTEHGGKFKEFFDNVYVVNDNQILDI